MQWSIHGKRTAGVNSNRSVEGFRGAMSPAGGAQGCPRAQGRPGSDHFFKGVAEKVGAVLNIDIYIFHTHFRAKNKAQGIKRVDLITCELI